MTRRDGRTASDVRPIRFERGFTNTAPGSVLASFGETRVLCTATWVDGVPPFLQGKGQGWLTAEYAMLPSSTGQRKSRDRAGTVEIVVYDVAGRRVATILESTWQPAGPGKVTLNTTGLPAGVYFIKMRMPAQSVSRKITVLR